MNTLPSVKWLLVDIGDVLLLKEKNVERSFTQLVSEELGVSIELAQEINKEHYITMERTYIRESDFIDSLYKKLNYKAPSNIYSYFENAYRKQVKANNKLLEYLNEVRAMGVKTAVLSNTIGIYKNIQEELGISQKNGFDPIIYSWEVGMRKPDTDIYDLSLSKLGVDPSEVIFIDDKEGHLDGARKTGLRTIQFNDTDEVISTLRDILKGNK